jgi:23S rRNA (uracil1939-C5)-methyltransferase
MAERLYAIAAEYAELRGRERVFDLYCGIGTLGLSLARGCGEVWGLEIVEEAVEDAAANAALNGIENARFLAANARTGIGPLLERAGGPDLVVVDPPRAGLAGKALRRVGRIGAPRIVYVSCDAATMARDARRLLDAGYRLTSLRGFDLFPNTPHVETLAVFEK